MLHANYKISPTWILAVPRCGSSFLVDVLNSTDLFDPKFKEFNLDYDYKEQIVKNPPKFIKLQRIFYDRKGFKDEEKDFLLKKHPNIRFIVIQRKNIIEQTVSHYFCEKTKIWFLKNKEDYKSYLNKKIEIDNQLLLNLYKINLSYFNCWKNFTKDLNHIEVFYEDLIENKKEFFDKISNFLKIKNIFEIAEKSKVIKMKRKETEFYYEHLKKLIS